MISVSEPIESKFCFCLAPRKGEAWVDAWMAENCKILETDVDMNIVPEFIAFKEQFRGIPGKEYLATDCRRFLVFDHFRILFFQRTQSFCNCL